MTLAQRPIPVLIAAVAACAAVVFGATLLAMPLGTALADWEPAWQDAAFALILYGLLALIAVIGRRLAAATAPGAPLWPWLPLGAAIGVGGLLLTLGDATLAGASC